MNKDLDLVERLAAPTPPFFRGLRKWAAIAGGLAAIIASAGAALPAVVVTIGGYLATASAAAVVVSSTTVDWDALAREQVRAK